MKGKTKYVFILLLMLGLGWMIKDSFDQPGVEGLKGGMKQVAFHRNDNNTGPVIRLYAVTVTDTLWEEMQKYGDLMPHNKYGDTKVYFFKSGGAIPHELLIGEQNFDTSLQTNCVARYEKNGMSQVVFNKFPFSTK